jgi:hypothetical protein
LYAYLERDQILELEGRAVEVGCLSALLAAACILLSDNSALKIRR